LRTAIDWKALGRSIAIYAGFGVFLAILNPFASVSGMPFHAAVAYWVSLIVWGGIAGETLGWLIQRRLPPMPAWAFTLVLSLAMTMVILPAVLLAEAVSERPVGIEDWPVLTFFVWVIAIAGTSLRLIVIQAFKKPAGQLAAAGAGVSASPTAFLERLPIRLRSAELYAIESEDHYLRIHTSAGQELILMRLADAVRELAGVEGLQTHRSWWVAKQGLADVVRGDGRLVLKLKSGAEAPVSRTYAKAVKDAGWA
jgi:hypothetical protein